MHLTAIPALKFNQIKGLFKVLLIMKIMLLLMLAFVAQAFAAGNAQVVTLSENNTSPKSVLTKIESQTGYYFWYENTLINKIGPISVKFKKLPLKDALDLCFTDQPVTYEIINKTILLKFNPITIFREVTGVIKDSSGNLLEGATIVIKGTKKQVVSNTDGRFSINAEDGDILVISYVGYASKEVLINTGQTEMDIVLQKNARENENIVVTALGIKRQEKALSYNLQRVSGDELTRNKDANFVNGLVGKIAGVTINSSSAGIGGGTRVVMRGPKSISNNNNALYVIDGIPVLNTTDLSLNGPAGQMDNIFSGNTASDIVSLIDPENIESISTLTGAAAAALYGSQGQNGVILITTKSGKAGKTSLGLSNNTAYFTPLVMPEFQNSYGQTEEGSYASWGAKLKTPSTYKPKDFFQTGNNTTVGLTLSTGTEKNQTFLSGSMVKANGIIPNNTLTRYNFNGRNTTKLLQDKLTLDLNTTYMYQQERNMVAQGLYHNPLVPIYLFPPGGNIEEFKVFERYNPSRLFPTQYWPYMGDQFRTENPWWIINREPTLNTTRRLLIGASLKYDVLNWLNLTARGKMDRVELSNDTRRYASTDRLFSGYGGQFNFDQTNAEVLYGDLFANINKRFGDYALDAHIGGQRTESSSRYISGGGGINEGSPPNIFTTDNISTASGNQGAGNARQPQRTSFQSAIASANVSYKNMFFLDGGYRIDWYSQLYFNDKSTLYLAYPSAGASVIVSELLHLQSPVLSFAKIRANYSQVGNPPRIYDGGPQVFNLNNGNIDQGSLLHLPLEPERTKSWEAGINLKFFDNKINLDATLYNTDTYNQIFRVTQSVTSGGNSTFLINAGQVNNKGIEAALGYNGMIGPLQWQSNAVFTLNKNTIKKLYAAPGPDGKTLIDVDTVITNGTSASYSQRAAVGGNLSAIYTSAQLFRDQNGYIMLNPGVSIDDKHYIYAGNADPKYTIGWNNGFSYKNFSLNFLVFARVGGVGVSATQAMMDAYGVSQITAEARDRGYVPLNGSEYKDVRQYYTQMGSGIGGALSHYVYSATNVRLRELSLGYTIPGKLLHNVVKSLRVALTGNNLFMFYNKAPFDPESTASTGTYYQGFDYFRQPSLRSFGFSINAQF
ncbi:SusC/RagA family TonB-linked outer membrane protein [Terrimonas rubra]|uniref:SusC/RagA family TonB-linked outer membrane protein n=1 Tax=Terrimonas rubra TaxID=1035890 RepID=A0ABW6A7R5_9BACT